MDVTTEKLRIGVVGVGGFAPFALGAFLKVPGVIVVAIYSRSGDKASEVAANYSAKPYSDFESFLHDDNIDLVYVATQPFLHYQQSKAALLAGKHVICEKPASLKTSEAEELAALARTRKLLYVVNLMQPYNPLAREVGKIIREKILGEFLHGYIENYASDCNMEEDHWFWDEEKSGGIFIEHGVHFFDLFSGWLGKGEVIHSAQWQRVHAGKKIIDRVQATVNYADGPVNFYHGFDQLDPMSRLEMKLEFENGEIKLYGWVPVRMKLYGLFNDVQFEKLRDRFPGCSIDEHKREDAGRETTGRFKKVAYDRIITLEYGNLDQQQEQYGLLLRSMIKDQWNWILDNSTKRIIEDTNAVESVRMAENAKLNARQY